ncbi:MAG: PAS domain-containing sensor histidine kinase [Aestuariivita sp.]|nr:PAS domain-containing sensor histidine kinase [Aestuariivita sp.]MCY4202656.1 PAS domain-containing sensor histidine kinase [Aestuariivita sp.]MCY4288483.1 PAS domain-containing sensor histidine kinase [Aestuariivita sp.]MCY4347067.1 PAS domain-containing sensor histidine kinase [Aestuariivita sp.]
MRAGNTLWVNRLRQLSRQRRLRNGLTIILVVLGPLLALVTFWELAKLDQGSLALGLRLMLLIDLVYTLTVAALVLSAVVRLIAARRARSAGSRLHLRLTATFVLLALIPTVSVAIFAGLTVNVGLEGWFSERVRQVVGTSFAAAQAYEQEQRKDLAEDAQALAGFIESQRRLVFINDAEVRQLLTQGQQQIQRGLKEAFLIDGTGNIRSRGERSYLFDFEQPSSNQLAQADNSGLVIIEDWDNNEFRALIRLQGFTDRFLYVSRQVDGDILALLDDTQATARLYQELESQRGRILFEFSLLYLGFAVILLLAATWFGLWFAERLSRPIGRLAEAAQQVGLGDLNVRVIEETSEDEIANLARYFNQMTRQLKEQRNKLLENNRQNEGRRRLFDSVLSSVTSGVVGLDPSGCITFANRSAGRLITNTDGCGPRDIAAAVPEFGSVFEQLRQSNLEVLQEQIPLLHNGRRENLLIRVSTRRNEDGCLEGYVLTFDDVTELVSAQRMAAWGEVARRIAHEIKNPLTPIQLSAERIKRKFSDKVGDERDRLENMIDVIVRQTEDLRRIVDEFSRFARMPEPKQKSENLIKLLQDVVLLHEAGQRNVSLTTDFPSEPVIITADATMMGQAFTNLIKNSIEAIDSFIVANPNTTEKFEIRLKVTVEGAKATISIADNGIGLPADRARLFEPYVTTRESGTGLGLPIVNKIIEEHGGNLVLEDAPKFAGQSRFGAMAVVTLPTMAVDFSEKQKNRE